MNIPAWRYYQQLYRDNYATLLFSVVLAILQGFILLPIAFLVRYTFDKVVPGNRIDLLLLTGGGIFLLYFLHSVSMLWTRTLVIKVTKLATQRFRYALLEKIYTLSRHYYTQADHSQIHTYLVQDTERIDVMANSVVGRLLPAVIISLTLCGVLLILNWFLFLTMLIVLPAVFFSSHYLSKMVKKRVRTFHACFRHFSRGMLFVLRMLDLTRIQTAEPYEYQRQQHHFNELRLASGAMIWSFNVFSLVQGTMATLAAVIILIIGGYAVMSATMTVGELLSFYVAVALLKNNLQGLASAIPQLIAGNESLTTLYHFLNIESEIPYQGQEKIDFEGHIRFENVYFRYHEQGHFVLETINWEIQPQTTVAIIGANGSGKSTLINLILGFYRPEQGQLYADDIPFDKLDIVYLRRSIGIILQEPMLFNGTIWENITYGRDEVSMNQVVEAAQWATAQGFIEKLPNGYQTLIGEGGTLLSGGQRQRIAITRALLHQPKCLILDEPTNHLDRATVAQLVDNLKQLATRPTILIISHDLDLVQIAQEVYTLHRGQLTSSTTAKIITLPSSVIH